ncbi:MAG: hypothetical protein KIT73_15815 [Burkholderiales bacterium]|nr:hypothetical protein [Burkholderiales bacterium]
MGMFKRSLVGFFSMIVLSGCATSIRPDQGAVASLPWAVPVQGANSAELTFSVDKRHESEDGTLQFGQPLICVDGVVSRPTQGEAGGASIRVEAGKSIAVTSVVQLRTARSSKLCAPFVEFTPEEGVKYIIVNEGIGTKGVFSLLAPIAELDCRVSVYRESMEGLLLVSTRAAAPHQCRITRD